MNIYKWFIDYAKVIISSDIKKKCLCLFTLF